MVGGFYKNNLYYIKVKNEVYQFPRGLIPLCIDLDRKPFLIIVYYFPKSSHPQEGFGSYPFILLNLILSCLAALQAPVIMMSQNRQEEKDRERSKKDYMVNLKSDLKIRILHEKIDPSIMHQQQELLEIQKV